MLFKRFLLIAGIIILILIFKDWLRTFVITSLGGYTTKENTIVREVEYIKGKIDTTAIFNHYVKTKGINLTPKPKIIYKYDTVYQVQDSLKQFKVQINDSLLLGTLTVENYFNGDLASTLFNYKPKFPKYITRTDTIRETKTITNTLSKDRAYFGLGAGYSTNQSFQFLGSYTKNNLQFIYEYEIPKIHSIKFVFNF